MTAEVGIINNNCVVLAADSAVSFGAKNYNTEFKLFNLAEGLPVGVMAYGSATILGIGFEMLLKLFRDEIKGTPLKSLEQYPEAFLKFLKRNMRRLFPLEFQKRGLNAAAIKFTDYWIEDINKLLDEHKNDSPSLPEFDDLRKIAKDDLCKAIKDIRSKKDFKDIPKGLDTYIQKLVWESISRVLKEQDPLSPLGMLSEDAFDKDVATLVTDLFVQNCRKAETRDIPVISVVFAGYGEDDMYPSIRCLKIQGIFKDRINFNYVTDKEFSVQNELSGSQKTYLSASNIIPFAQADEMVEAFIEGIPISFARKIIELVEDIAKDENVSPKTVSKIIDTFSRKMRNVSLDTYAYPLRDILHALPREEMCQMAELLVKLTSFRQRVSSESESVSEPIDVAVISKCDGFVWYRRKTSLTKQ